MLFLCFEKVPFVFCFELIRIKFLKGARNRVSIVTGRKVILLNFLILRSWYPCATCQSSVPLFSFSSGCFPLRIYSIDFFLNLIFPLLWSGYLYILCEVRRFRIHGINYFVSDTAEKPLPLNPTDPPSNFSCLFRQKWPRIWTRSKVFANARRTFKNIIYSKF